MAINRRFSETKQPYEELPIDVNFGLALPPGSNEIVSASASAIKWPRRKPNEKSDALDFLVSETPVILNPGKTKVRIHIKGGIHDYDYQVTVRVVFNNGAKLEEELYFRVRED